jgi:hypothetical protein
MTTKELINELQKHPDDLDVIVYCGLCFGYIIKEIGHDIINKRLMIRIKGVK